MEIVEGEDLSHPIARGPMALRQALAIARQIAEAIQAAHDHGIVHRDLKPANVKVKADGTVKVLDFGLAKAADAQPADSSPSQAPTMMTSMPGTLLGTAAYMSPEQVKGQTADARSDVWAFGCLLFEMLTGRPAFAAATTSEILASVLSKDPDWRRLAPDTPESVRRLLRRCLEKDETNRLRAIADARLEIDEAQQPDRDVAHSRTPTHSRTERLVWASVVAFLSLVLLALGVWSSRRLVAPPEVRFDITTPEVPDPLSLSSVALSPDGRQILFVADSEGQPHVWFRAINTVSARPLAGTGGAAFPFWSPDGHSIAFYADGQLFLYYVAGAPDSRGIHVGRLDGSSQRLVDADGGGVYKNGHLLFIRHANVFAQAFGADRLELKGSPFQVAEGVFGRSGQFLTLSASAGALAFRVGEARYARQFTWVDRSGREIATVGDRLGDPDGVSWSPDRSQLVFFERGAISSDLWMLDVRRGVVSRFTDDPDEDIFPLWTRDGNRIIYSAIRNGRRSLYQRPVGAGQRELLLQSQTEDTFVSDTSPDGRYIVYQRINAKSGWDIWALPREPNATPIPVVQTDADERSARLSPDGRWIAFVSNNSGVSEIYVQPFPGPGRRLQVSTKGGDEPQWRPDGAELFYLALDGRLTATSIKQAPDHQSIDIGAPV